MKVFISGADGALGIEMHDILKREGVQVYAADMKQLDVADFRKTNEALLQYRPDVIVHCAAISNVDVCETTKDLAFRVNTLSSLGLATIARKLNAKMVYISTNFVFDGTQEQPYHEYSLPNPINEYGRTKLFGEQGVKDICHRHFIVRTSWMFGKHTKNYIPQFLVNENKPGSIDVICDLFASFTYVPDLAEALFLLIKSENFGIYHIVNRGSGSWLDFVLKAKEQMQFKTEPKPVTTEELHLPAPRPRFSPLESRHYEFLFNRNMRSWEEALAAFIKSITRK